MIKSKKYYFFKKKVCNEDEKNLFMSIKLDKFHGNPRIEENEK